MKKLFKSTNYPIWMLRQAGRYMPEYMEIRNNYKNFLGLCYDIDSASAVTMQPIKRYNTDAAILFSDILLILDAYNWDVTFKKGEGPLLRQFKTKDDLNIFSKKPDKKIKNVYEIVKKIRSNLSADKFLIGFAGSPWTVACYLIEGRGKTDFAYTKTFAYQNPELVMELIEKLTIMTIDYLSNQIEHGADVIMLFDSWAGILNEQEFKNYVIEPTKNIVSVLRKKYPDVAFIGFPRASGYNYEKYITDTLVDIVSVDQFVPLSSQQKWQKEYDVVLQGNLDPLKLLTNEKIIAESVDNIFEHLGSKKFIFNLGHGILPTTPVKNVEFLVNYVRQKRTEYE